MFRRRVAQVAVAAGAIMAIAIPSAFGAALHYKITAGTTASGSVAYSGKTSKAIVFTDKTSKTTLGCKAGTAAGVIKLGKSVAAAKAGTITKTTWTNCTGPGSIQLFPKQVGKWYLNGRGKTAKGNTPVFVNNVVANVADSSGSLCKFTVKGAADGVYHNATKTLTLAPVGGSGHVLKTYNVSGCFGLLNSGDVVTFKTTYKINTPKGALKILNS
jgi:hypothetical protein